MNNVSLRLKGVAQSRFSEGKGLVLCCPIMSYTINKLRLTRSVLGLNRA